MNPDTLERPDVHPPTTPRQPIGLLAVGMLLLIGGALWLLDVLGAAEIRFALVLPIFLTVIGLTLMIGAFRAPQAGLVVAGILVAVATVVAAITPPNAFHGGIGLQAVTITSQADLQPRYDVGVGELRLDLRNLRMTESAEVAASVGAGELTVILPPDMSVAIEASTGAGEIDLFGQKTEGISRTLDYVSSDFDTAPATLRLRLSVAAGDVEVRR